jgi:uncharacterized membrane protein SpoIIM required for sporulation
MVFEFLINPKKAERYPYQMVFIGVFYATLAVLLSLWIFQEEASLVMVFLTVMACIHLIHGVLQLEEEKDLVIKDERLLIKEHGKALSFFIFMFLGFIIGYLIWNIFLPTDISTKLFEVQQETISSINSKVSGSAINGYDILTKIFFNNIKVLFFCLIFSLFYGSGTVFILAWNASVIAAAMGNVVRLTMAKGIFTSISYALGKYLLHGIPEIAGYFVAGLAGGIISVAIIKHEFGSERFIHILIDSMDLIVLSVVILAISAILEVYVTPAIF